MGKKVHGCSNHTRCNYCSAHRFLVLGQISILKPEVSRVIASGGAGTWFTFGYLAYIVIGVMGIAISSAFYHYL